MTDEQFDKTSFNRNDKVIFEHQEYEILGIDFLYRTFTTRLRILNCNQIELKQ